jgi:hypothetical protein
MINYVLSNLQYIFCVVRLKGEEGIKHWSKATETAGGRKEGRKSTKEGRRKEGHLRKEGRKEENWNGAPLTNEKP